MPDSTFVRIFAGRAVDYYVEKTVQDLLKKMLQLIEADTYDVICVHPLEYDTQAHAHGPKAEEALQAVSIVADGFDKACKALKKFEGKHRILYSFSPDHGQHLVPGGTGNHNSLIVEDINIIHFFGTV